MANLKEHIISLRKRKRNSESTADHKNSFRFSLFASSVKTANSKQLPVSDVEKKAADIQDMV